MRDDEDFLSCSPAAAAAAVAGTRSQPGGKLIVRQSDDVFVDQLVVSLFIVETPRVRAMLIRERVRVRAYYVVYI